VSLQVKVATAGDASEEQTEKLAELAKERGDIQRDLDDASAQVRVFAGSLCFSTAVQDLY
jgi:peptidoglycan hydrolase CwlO-like protein